MKPKIISKYITKEFLTPFILSNIVILFILLINFFIKKLDRFLGKGLDTFTVLEYIFYNLGWILALSVPMSVLISTIMTFGRFSSDNETTALKALGFSFNDLLRPMILISVLLTISMMYYNNFILPEMNHKARLLSVDISRKRPDLKFEPGYFINDIPNYTFYIEKKDGDFFENITIYQTLNRKNEKIIVAQKGQISSIPNGILLNLENGTIQEKLNETDIHEIYFNTYQVSVPIDNLNLKRRDSKIRGDRELNYLMINEKIKSNNDKISTIKSRVKSRIKKELNKSYSSISMKDDLLASIESDFSIIRDSIRTNFPDKIGKTDRILKQMKRGITSDLSLIENYTSTNNKYLVELHKKFSIPFACIVFVLIGMTLGISSRKKGLGMSISLSLIFFVIYWAFLIAGEEFADRGLIVPWLSMWLPNIVLGSLSIFFVHRLNNNKNPLFIDL